MLMCLGLNALDIDQGDTLQKGIFKMTVTYHSSDQWVNAYGITEACQVIPF